VRGGLSEDRSISRRLLLAGAGALAASPALAAGPRGVRLEGRLVQGGYVVGWTAPGAQVLVNGQAVAPASRRGAFVVGFDRDEGPSVQLEVRAGGEPFRRTLAIGRGKFGVQRIDGVPQDTVTPTDPGLLARIRTEAAMKAQAYASSTADDAFADGFSWPLKTFRNTSKFGNQRILNGVPNRPHYGFDMAAPAGTPILAPAGGLVVFARPRMHYEGGLTMIDHGEGLVCAYLHQSKQLVSAGERVIRGQRIGSVGMTGRATGPHLCWRLTWRGRHLDPSLWVGSRPGT
jgi:murein DD-endopeptidase MepM/ murein hydrolase activator NlpD